MSSNLNLYQQRSEKEREYAVQLTRAAMLDLDERRELIRIKIENELIELSRIKHQYNKLLFDLDLMNEL